MPFSERQSQGQSERTQSLVESINEMESQAVKLSMANGGNNQKIRNLDPNSELYRSLQHDYLELLLLFKEQQGYSIDKAKQEMLEHFGGAYENPDDFKAMIEMK